MSRTTVQQLEAHVQSLEDRIVSLEASIVELRLDYAANETRFERIRGWATIVQNSIKQLRVRSPVTTTSR